jgi:ribosomal protein S18 acetylase RimI-like enzyme
VEIGDSLEHADLSFRAAILDDVDELSRLIETAYRAEQSEFGWTSERHLVSGARSSPDQIGAIIASTESVILLGELNGEIISCCRLSRKDQNEAHFGMFCVHPLHQSNGYGTRMIQFAQQEAEYRFQSTKLVLWVFVQRRELWSWYERLGFVTLGERVPFAQDDDPSLALIPDLEFFVYEKNLGMS